MRYKWLLIIIRWNIFTEHGTCWCVRCVLVCASFPATQPQHDGGGVVVYLEWPLVSDVKPAPCLVFKEHGRPREKFTAAHRGSLVAVCTSHARSSSLPLFHTHTHTHRGGSYRCTSRDTWPPMCPLLEANTGHVLALHDDSLRCTDPKLNPAALLSGSIDHYQTA